MKGNLKRVLGAAVCLAAVLCGMTWGGFVADAAASGTCGEHLNWSLADDGTLTISGDGDMGDYLT